MEMTIGVSARRPWRLATALALASATAVRAEDATIDTGDTAWLLTASALVLMMTAPGLALFYGGLVRSKNVLNLLMQSFIMMAVISILWVLFGYSLAFGTDHGGVIGGVEWVGLHGIGVGDPAPLAPTIPHHAFVMFQMMFAIITPALITGAFAERMKFGAFLVFSVLWATIVYLPLAHMVWGGGILFHGGSLVGVQVVATVVTYGIAIVGTLVCLAITRAVVGGIRGEQDDEYTGLDLSQHSETAYVLGPGA